MIKDCVIVQFLVLETDTDPTNYQSVWQTPHRFILTSFFLHKSLCQIFLKALNVGMISCDCPADPGYMYM